MQLTAPSRRPEIEDINDKTRDLNYAPPEVLYRRAQVTLDDRFAADLYQLGSVAVYLFTSTGMNAHLCRDIPPMHHWNQWSGSYEDVLPYLAPQFESAISRVSDAVDSLVRDELIGAIRQLCNPDVNLRGDLGHKLAGQPRYGVRRFVSLFDRLATKAEHALKIKR